MDPNRLESLASMLECFIDGTDRSPAFVTEIRAAFDRWVPPDEELDQFLTLLACYDPRAEFPPWSGAAMAERARAATWRLRRLAVELESRDRDGGR